MRIMRDEAGRGARCPGGQIGGLRDNSREEWMDTLHSCQFCFRPYFRVASKQRCFG